MSYMIDSQLRFKTEKIMRGYPIYPMKTRPLSCLFAAGLLLATVSFAQTPALTRAQQAAKAKAENVPEIPFETVPNFLKLPAGLYLGEGIGVATNSKGHVFVYTRSQDTRLFEFDKTGAFIKEIGEGLYGFQFAHAVRVDAQDNIWCVDEGTNMVIKFSPEGKVLMVIGHRPESVDGKKFRPALPLRRAEYMGELQQLISAATRISGEWASQPPSSSR